MKCHCRGWGVLDNGNKLGRTKRRVQGGTACIGLPCGLQTGFLDPLARRMPNADHWQAPNHWQAVWNLGR